MVDYAEALALARKCWNEIDYYRETENAFIFSKYDDVSIGGTSPVVVLKDTGECLPLVAYITEGLNTPDICEGRI